MPSAPRSTRSAPRSPPLRGASSPKQLKTLEFVGVPAHEISSSVRAALEQAWFEHRPLVIRYRNADGVLTRRTVKVSSVVMDRAVTLLQRCDDLDKGESEAVPTPSRIEGATLAQRVSCNAAGSAYALGLASKLLGVSRSAAGTQPQCPLSSPRV